MNDLISKQAVIDTIHDYWKTMIATVPTKITKYGITYDTKQLNKILEYNKKLVELIKAIPPEPEKVAAEVEVDTDEIMKRVKNEIFPLIPHWIPVTEQLPEERKPVLLSQSFGLMYVGFLIGKSEDGTAIWLDLSSNLVESHGDTFAWIPLPESYRE